MLAGAVAAESLTAEMEKSNTHGSVLMFNGSNVWRNQSLKPWQQKDKYQASYGILTKKYSGANISNSGLFAHDATCRNINNISIYTVHIPKAGGSSLACTFIDSRDNSMKCPNVRAVDGKNISLLGVQHENYQDILETRLKCDGLIYQKSVFNICLHVIQNFLLIDLSFLMSLEVVKKAVHLRERIRVNRW